MHVLFAATKAANVNVVLVQQFKEEVAKGCLGLQLCMRLVTIATTGDDGGQVVTSMIGGISKVAAHHHGRMVEQRAATFRNLIKIEQELVVPTKDICFDATQCGNSFRATAMVRQRMPTAGGPGYFDGSIDPIQCGNGDRPMLSSVSGFPLKTT